MSDESNHGYPGAPMWAKILGGLLAVAIVALIILRLLGAGDHGPGRHVRGTDARSPAVEHP